MAYYRRQWVTVIIGWGDMLSRNHQTDSAVVRIQLWPSYDQLHTNIVTCLLFPLQDELLSHDIEYFESRESPI